MNAGYKLRDGGRVDVETVEGSRRVKVTYVREDLPEPVVFTMTVSETRAVSSGLMGAGNEA